MGIFLLGSSIANVTAQDDKVLGVGTGATESRGYFILHKKIDGADAKLSEQTCRKIESFQAQNCHFREFSQKYMTCDIYIFYILKNHNYLVVILNYLLIYCKESRS